MEISIFAGRIYRFCISKIFLYFNLFTLSLSASRWSRFGIVLHCGEDVIGDGALADGREDTDRPSSSYDVCLLFGAAKQVLTFEPFSVLEGCTEIQIIIRGFRYWLSGLCCYT